MAHGTSNSKLFVGRLPYSKTEEDIVALFSTVGQVFEIHLLRDQQTQQKKGAAFVTMQDEVTAAAAITHLDGYFFPGTPRPISVSWAKGGGGLVVPPPPWATPEPVAPPPQPDAPGLYRITHKGGTFVGSEVGIISGEIAQLQEGTFVQVLEVVDRPDLKRIRARIGNPGWISLLNTETGYRWAAKAEPRGPKRNFNSMSHGSSVARPFVGQLLSQSEAHPQQMLMQEQQQQQILLQMQQHQMQPHMQQQLQLQMHMHQQQPQQSPQMQQVQQMQPPLREPQTQQLQMQPQTQHTQMHHETLPPVQQQQQPMLAHMPQQQLQQQVQLQMEQPMLQDMQLHRPPQVVYPPSVPTEPQVQVQMQPQVQQHIQAQPQPQPQMQAQHPQVGQQAHQQLLQLQPSPALLPNLQGCHL